MPADPRMLEVMSYYRDAELHGANLLLRLIKLMDDDPDAQIKLTLHVAEETQHAWLWTKRMMEIGGAPVKIRAGYQTRMGRRTVPRSITDLLALTIVVEERSLMRYREHAARADVDATTREVLLAVSKDEKWHIAWMRNKLKALTAHDPEAETRADQMSERYREMDQEVYAELLAREKELFGENIDVPQPESLQIDAAELVRSGAELPTA